MPRDKSESHQRVIKAAREEFLEKGFIKASMRRIGQRAGMTSAGLYRHYKNKEDMFDDLVRPVINELDEFYDDHMQNHYKMIDNNAPAAELFQTAEIYIIKDVFYKHKEEFTLLLKCAQGTKYENFIHDAVHRQQKDFMEALSYMRKKGMKIKAIDEKELHVLLSAYITAIIEPLVHDWPKEKAEHCMRITAEFFMPGWQKIMGF